MRTNTAITLGEPPLAVEIATCEDDITAAQALRYQVFADEMGAALHSPYPGLDHDQYDAYCHHLLVRDRNTGRVVACTRILEGWQADHAGGFYSNGEFHIDAVLALPGRKLEIGRTCVDPLYRDGATIGVLWSGLAAFVTRYRYDYLLGCASIGVRDGGQQANAIMERLRPHHMTPEHLRVTPHKPLPATDMHNREKLRMPPLIRAYMALGARVCGEPCLDPDFQVADIFILLDLRNLSPRYARHFLGGERRRGCLAA